MNTNVPRQIPDDEISLHSVYRGIGNFFNSLSASLFNLIMFVRRKFIWVLLLVIIGVAAGIFLDSIKVYEHRLIVRPNFRSTDYLYSKIDLLDAKITEQDTAFIRSLGVKHPRRLKSIKIEPLVDVYNFVAQNELNFRTLELLAEDGDLNKIVKDNTTSKHYENHLITYVTVEATDFKSTVEPLIDFFNDSDFFGKVQIESVNNLKSKLQSNEILIRQIDAILESIPRTSVGTGSTVVNGESQLNEVIETKDKLIQEQAFLKVELLSLDRIVKMSESSLNIKKTGGTKGKMKIIIPLLLLSLFGLIYLFIQLYKNEARKRTNQ